MHLLRHERAEQLRSRAQEAAGANRNTDLVELAGGDTALVQTAWSSFVPYLAHPVMAGSAGGAMALLDQAATALSRRPVSA